MKCYLEREGERKGGKGRGREEGKEREGKSEKGKEREGVRRGGREEKGRRGGREEGRGRRKRGESNVKLSSYLFVVIQNSVHVFNPNGINGPIKYDPLAIIREGRRLLPESVGEDAVGPLMAHLVEAPV